MEGVVLSADDFFVNGDKYEWDVKKLSDAHVWNQKRGQQIKAADVIVQFHFQYLTILICVFVYKIYKMRERLRFSRFDNETLKANCI